MPVSAETAARSEAPTTSPVLEEQSPQSQVDQPHPPSETVSPTKVTDASQQGATQPGSGSTVSAHEGDFQPSFKEKVIGYAKEIRGTTLRQPETKEEGQRILSGEEKFETKKVGPKA